MRKLSVLTCVADPPVSGGTRPATGCSALRRLAALTGTLVGFGSADEPLVDVAGAAAGTRLPARTCVPLQSRDIGREVVLVFESGNPESPIVLGVVQPEESREVEIDGQTIVVSAQHTLTFECGEASITLNRDGKIVIRGAHVVSHAAGVNRIRGGSVQLN